MIIGISGKIGSGKDTVAKIIQYLNDINRSVLTFEEWCKDYSLSATSSWEIKKFAYKLKIIVSMLTGCTLKQLEDEEFKNSLLSDEWQIFELYNFGNPMGTSRFGEFTPTNFPTEVEAQVFCQIRSNSQHSFTYQKSSRTYRWLLQDLGTRGIRGVHPNAHINALMVDYKKDNWIITDTRFKNEAEAIKRQEGFLIRVVRPSMISTSTHPSEVDLDDYDGFNEVLTNDGSIEDLLEKVKDMLNKYTL